MDLELKNKIIQGTIRVYNTKGLKLTMDDVASEIGISKKTIYKVYRSKEELFDDVVDYVFDGIKMREEEILREPGLSITDRTRKLLAAFPEGLSEVDFTKLDTLKDKYPKVYKKVNKRLDSGWEPTLELLREGQRQGLYRSDMNPLIFKEMMDTAIAGFFETDVLAKNKIKYLDALNEVVDILLGGILVKA